MHEIVNALKFLLNSLAERLRLGIWVISRLRFGALRYKVPKVDLVHWYFNAPFKVAA
ncbi:hypothetical protein MPF85_05605 [Helicobacter pylori]|nr:hypothetical protein [Helicobacter pylori]UOR24786.1 hypothetical protein MPF85_05605 [Helicobacter pylori]UOS63982.1 hypothetical protein MPG42_01870 [Helicobacter pylori]